MSVLTDEQIKLLDSHIKESRRYNESARMDAEGGGKDNRFYREYTVKANGVPIRLLIIEQKNEVFDFMAKINSIAAEAGLSTSVMAGKLLLWSVEQYAKNETIPFDDLSLNDKFGAMLIEHEQNYLENWQKIDEYYHRVAIIQGRPEEFWKELEAVGGDAEAFKANSIYYYNERLQVGQSDKEKFEHWLYSFLLGRGDVPTKEIKAALEPLEFFGSTWEDLSKHAARLGVTGKKYGHWTWTSQAHEKYSRR